MKKFIKVVGIVVGAIIVLGVIGSIIGGNNSSSQPTKQASPVNSEVKTQETTTQPQQPHPQQPTSKISQETFDQIKTGDTLTGDGGMSEDEVKAILGNPDGNVSTTTNTMGKEYKMDTMTWSAGLSMKSITVMFVNGHAASKNLVQ